MCRGHGLVSFVYIPNIFRLFNIEFCRIYKQFSKNSKTSRSGLHASQKGRHRFGFYEVQNGKYWSGLEDGQKDTLPFWK